METSGNENLAEEMEMTNSGDDIGGEADELHQEEHDEMVENIESDENIEVDGNNLKIGLFVQRSSADGINLIPGLQKKIWTPPDGYSFPASGPRNLKFQRSWLLTYSWLAYSEREDGAFCKCCVLFCARAGGVGRQTLGQLVTNPLRNWKKALDTFEKHNASEYHKRSLLQWSLRLKIEDENALSIDLQLSKQKLDFINENFTGKGIGTSYLNFLDSSGLNCTYFLGQGYDGARAVSGEFHGAQAVVRERYPLALYSHCAAHSFNLAVSSACNITAIRNCLGTLESIHTFFIYPKRQNALQDAINEDETLRESRLKKLKKFCKTRWVEQHESVATYLHLQPAVIRALDVISTTWKDPTTSSGAFQLLSAIKTANFQISMHILSSVHSLTLSLSRVLQSENQDLGEAIELADAAKQVLLERRENAEKDFRGIIKTVSEISAKYDIELRKPRLASKQTQRSNVQTDSVQDYFRITIYIPYIDLFLTHIQDRFLNHRKILSNFACLFPNKMKNFNEESCAQLFEPYSSILRDDSRDIWVDEVKLWRQRIAGKNVKNSLEALDVCNGDAFPNVHQMLRILAVLPVTTATNERSFSTLRRLKTYLRSTMSEDRLNGLASLNIHRDVEVDPQRVLEKFFSTPRRVNLLYNN
ncbi:52 kDa repressor of the inhibitor of the protein kinase-like [Diabrotica virgifera virgifera]|uniref:TTF-type domain-containing protein n=1 Tax=Diabrotica virgifera virgifera TaxID=50390 RepID=A0ABM5JSP9_DIAVI|nr:52 kDa repressor of the inhibitor of the protein kinase-like [Diabrotica virgifera virgifera]